MQPKNIYFPKIVDLPCFLFRAAVFIRLKSPFAARFKLCQFSFLRVPLCVCVCTRLE